MAFKDIHKLKKIVEIKKEEHRVYHLVLGKDIFAVSIYDDLKNKFGKENVRLLSHGKIQAADLLPKGPTLLRGEANRLALSKVYPELSLQDHKTIGALFYKDMSWKKFEGRSKSEPLKFDEPFFTTERLDIDYRQLFEEKYFQESFLENINSEVDILDIHSINKIDEIWIVECLNGTTFYTEFLYCGLTPYLFLKHYSDKNALTDTFIEFCEKTITPSVLHMSYLFKGSSEKFKVLSLEETLFIPLSYTHEWGHFIGEFSKQSTGCSEFSCIYYIDQNTNSEEDVTRIIRTLKKNLEKIFKNFFLSSPEEFISFENETMSLNVDDELFSHEVNKNPDFYQNLFFIGTNAPLKFHADTSCANQVSGIIRGILSRIDFLNSTDLKSMPLKANGPSSEIMIGIDI